VKGTGTTFPFRELRELRERRENFDVDDELVAASDAVSDAISDAASDAVSDAITEVFSEVASDARGVPPSADSVDEFRSDSYPVSAIVIAIASELGAPRGESWTSLRGVTVPDWGVSISAAQFMHSCWSWRMRTPLASANS
jgi:hypothetical protein